MSKEIIRCRYRYTGVDSTNCYYFEGDNDELAQAEWMILLWL